MRTTSVRLRTSRNAPLQRLILATVAVAVAAILLGLVTMHAMGAGSSDHSAAPHAAISSSAQTTDDAATAAHAHRDQSGLGESVSSGAAVGLAAGDCVIVGMLCALGILAVLFTLALIARVPVHRFFSNALRVITIAANGVSIPRPPSLLVLSISRT